MVPSRVTSSQVWLLFIVCSQLPTPSSALRHVLIEKHYPHHCAVMFGHQGKYLWEVLKYMGIPVDEIDYNFPKGNFYPTENPFA